MKWGYFVVVGVVGTVHGTKNHYELYDRIEAIVRDAADRNVQVRQPLRKIEGFVAELNESYALTASADQAALAQEAALCRAAQGGEVQKVNRAIRELVGELYQLSSRDTVRKRELQRKINKLKHDRHRLLIPLVKDVDPIHSLCDGACVARRIELVTGIAEEALRLVDALEATSYAVQLETLCAQARAAAQQRAANCDIEADQRRELLGRVVADAYR